uniref:Uncharacterized protein n=1 Tax=Rhizophora mucronata TaxID=61149 RepID=A0A2P2Q4J9_RHIMU
MTLWLLTSRLCKAEVNNLS